MAAFALRAVRATLIVENVGGPMHLSMVVVKPAEKSSAEVVFSMLVVENERSEAW